MKFLTFVSSSATLFANCNSILYFSFSIPCILSIIPLNSISIPLLCLSNSNWTSSYTWRGSLNRFPVTPPFACCETFGIPKYSSDLGCTTFWASLLGNWWTINARFGGWLSGNVWETDANGPFGELTSWFEPARVRSVDCRDDVVAELASLPVVLVLKSWSFLKKVVSQFSVSLIISQFRTFLTWLLMSGVT